MKKCPNINIKNFGYILRAVNGKIERAPAPDNIVWCPVLPPRDPTEVCMHQNVINS
jgi:hypothetical protein